MPALYTSAAAVRTYVGDGVTLPQDDARLVELIERAELWVDRICGGPIHPTRGRRFDPLALTGYQALALGRAVAAAVRELVELGDDWTGDDGVDAISVGGVSLRLSPPSREPRAVLDELIGWGLIGRSGMADPGLVV